MKSKKFYQILMNPQETAAWYLGDLASEAEDGIDPRMFTKGEFYPSASSYTLEATRVGKELDFNFSSFNMIVATRLVVDILRSQCEEDVQLIPVEIMGKTDDFYILNVCRRIKCFDRSKSIFTEWHHGDGREDKIGSLRMVIDLKIDPAKVDGVHIFRVHEWPIALIVSEQIKNLFSLWGVKGVVYEQV